MSTSLNEVTVGDIMDDVGTKNVDLSDDVSLLMPRNSAETVSSLPKKDGKRRRRSSVWDGFKIIPEDKYDDGKERAECLKCKIVYRAGTSIDGTGTLRRHLKNCAKQDKKDIKQMMFSTIQGNMEMTERKIDVDIVRDKITRLIVKQKLPLEFVEDKELRNLISYLCLEYYHISCNSQMAQITKLYHFEDKIIKDFFKSYNGKISLKSDMWTFITNDGYISIAESIDDVDDVAMALGNVLSTNETGNDVASTVSTVGSSSTNAQ
ncbi:hypothetical protein NE237_016867 [Protea cynaroides]|uniref:BED-type domain-containing protein n=1 Tax=Protea cynaroides TaxID=273540 RepID=A0A9Q0HHR5_9MAGN|nr:hypothetical protein NE237_016867 [Protea cynaroides]